MRLNCVLFLSRSSVKQKGCGVSYVVHHCDPKKIWVNIFKLMITARNYVTFLYLNIVGWCIIVILSVMQKIWVTIFKVMVTVRNYVRNM